MLELFFEHPLTPKPTFAPQVQPRWLALWPFNLPTPILVQHCDLLEALGPADSEEQPQPCLIPNVDTSCAQGFCHLGK